MIQFSTARSNRVLAITVSEIARAQRSRGRGRPRPYEPTGMEYKEFQACREMVLRSTLPKNTQRKILNKIYREETSSR